MKPRGNAVKRRSHHQKLVDIGFPCFDDYFQAEKNTVEYLAGSGELASAEDEFSGKMQSLRSKLCAWESDTKKDTRSFCLDFYGTIDSNVETRKSSLSSATKWHKVGLGAYIEFNARHQLKFSTFAVEIFGARGSRYAERILTRMHFDVASPSVEGDSKFPIYHLQFGGHPGDGVAYSQYDADFKALSYPRLLALPLSLALFLDMVFRELGSKDIKKLVEDGKWRNLVHDNEELMLYPWFECLLESSRSHKKNLADVYYET